VINTATNTVVATIPTVEVAPFAVAITPDGTRAYVTNIDSDDVSVINTATNMTVGLPIPVGDGPIGVAITPDGTRAYVANLFSGNVSVIDTATNTTVGLPIPVELSPRGVAITPPPPPRNVPTLSEWGLITMAGILGIVGFMVIRRRKVTA